MRFQFTDDDEYVAFGLSGSETSAQMEGADVALVYVDQFQGYAKDYNVTAKSTCVSVLGAYRGVCSDEQVGGTDNNQFFLSSRKDGLTTITYRRSLNPRKLSLLDIIQRPVTCLQPVVEQGNRSELVDHFPYFFPVSK